VHQILSNVSKRVPYSELFNEWVRSVKFMFWKTYIIFHLVLSIYMLMYFMMYNYYETVSMFNNTRISLMIECKLTDISAGTQTARIQFISYSTNVYVWLAFKATWIYSCARYNNIQVYIWYSRRFLHCFLMLLLCQVLLKRYFVAEVKCVCVCVCWRECVNACVYLPDILVIPLIDTSCQWQGY
jgi:hypothetical protein